MSKALRHSGTTTTPPTREDRLILEAGKFSLDIAKLVFAGVVLAGLMKEDIDYALLFPIGLLVSLIFVVVGFLYLSKLK